MPDLAMLDYFYGDEAEQFTFYRIPKVLFTDPSYRRISSDAKILYGLMLDRMGLSVRNGWLDEYNRVFIFFTLEDALEYLCCGHTKAVSLFGELDKAGLIERKKQGQGKPTKIYVKNFVRNAEVLTSEKRKSKVPQSGSQDFQKTASNNTEIKDTELSDTEPSIHPARGLPEDKSPAADAMDTMRVYRQIIMENIEYDITRRQLGYDADILDEIVDIMVDTVCSTKPMIRIGGQDFPLEVVKSRLLKLNSEHVQLGETLIVKAGESVPVDGIVIEGFSSVDESALTGESIPVEKHIGDKVIGATTSKSGYFKMQATKVGDDTTLAQIVRLVDEATSSKAPIAKLADKVSGVFVPVVITISLIAVVVWLLLGYGFEFALSIGISILVISCPCALGLATPTAIMVGTGKGATNGILIKSAEALETAHNIDTVVLDKTGTITQGTPVVTNMLCKEGIRSKELLQIAASLEKLSEHPLADAIVTEAEKEGLSFLPVSDFKQIPGQGIVGWIGDDTCLAGNRRLIEANGIQGGALLQLGEEMAVDGKTPLFFARGGQLIGVIAVADVVKPTSRQAVQELARMGIEVVMLTGDNAKTAEAIRRQVGVNRVVAEVFPQDKEKEIRRLQNEGKKVAMVGDGINDAPALARADVGIAIGAGTDVAIESADIVLMKSDLLDVSTAIQLSKAVIRNIKQNLFWAFIYNIIGIPVAAGLFYLPFDLKLNPMIGAFAMSFSSVFVVSNALRLRWFKAKHLSHTEPDTAQSYAETPAKKISKGAIEMEKVLNIEGMVCMNCVKHVDKALREIQGIREVSVSLENKSAQVQLNQDVPDEVLKAAIEDAGYQVVGIQ